MMQLLHIESVPWKAANWGGMRDRMYNATTIPNRANEKPKKNV